MKPAVSILLLYIGFVVGSLQVLAFQNKWEGLGVLIGVTMILLIVGMMHARVRPQKAIPRKLKNRVVRHSKASKSRVKVVKS